MELECLANNEKALPILANWYFNEWGYLQEGNTLEIKGSEHLKN